MSSCDGLKGGLSIQALLETGWGTGMFVCLHRVTGSTHSEQHRIPATHGITVHGLTSEGPGSRGQGLNEPRAYLQSGALNRKVCEYVRQQ